MKKIVFALCLLVAFSASAKDCEKESEGGGMVALRECIAGQNAKPVEQAFQNLLKVHANNEYLIANAKEAQSTWEAFRNATCIYIGETVSREDQAMCMDEFNKARVKILNGYVKAAKAGN